MKIVRRDCADGSVCLAMGWLRGSTVGLCRRFVEDRGFARGVSEKHLVVVAVASLCALDAVGEGRGRAFARLRIAGLVDMIMH